jgi:polysaccharide export outer membrane protein
MKRTQHIFFITGLLFLLTSCGVNSNIMFQNRHDEVITEDIPLSPSDAYRLSPNDKISFTMFVEDGKSIIGIGGDGSGGGQNSSGSITYLIRDDGQVELPVIGFVEIDGLTIIEAQIKLAKLFSTVYKRPFVQLEVTNRRVIVFPGAGGDAKVVPIENNNTTLMEAIALAGGISERGKAKVVKLMRLTDEGRKVYQIDLSTLENLKYADMVVQSNDYIYVEPTKQLSREFLKEVTPLVSLISSAIIIISVITSFK